MVEAFNFLVGRSWYLWNGDITNYAIYSVIQKLLFMVAFFKWYSNIVVLLDFITIVHVILPKLKSCSEYNVPFSF